MRKVRKVQARNNRLKKAYKLPVQRLINETPDSDDINPLTISAVIILAFIIIGLWGISSYGD